MPWRVSTPFFVMFLPAETNRPQVETPYAAQKTIISGLITIRNFIISSHKKNDSSNWFGWFYSQCISE